MTQQSDNDDIAYREEVTVLAVWCQDNNFSLNVSKQGSNVAG
jgi:hypothetical protein